jgi:hypothetical protein
MVSIDGVGKCVVDESGKVVREAKVASELVALINWIKSLGVRVERIGLEAGPLFVMAGRRVARERIGGRLDNAKGIDLSRPVTEALLW